MTKLRLRQRLKRPPSRSLLVERLEDRRLLAASPWRNPIDALDADADSFVVPADVLKLINDLNGPGARQLPAIKDPALPFLDIDGDGFIAPIDVLKIINHLNAGNSENGRRQLAESGVLANETTVTISLGQTAGTRIYRVQLDAMFDISATGAAIEDVLAVYLVNPNSPNQTLLDRGTPGTTIFTLAGTKVEFVPGLVRWDGSVLEVDATSLASRDTGLLKFQLLSSDSDTGTRVTITPLTNAVDPEGIASPRLDGAGAAIAAGAATNLASLTPAPNADVEVENVRFNAATGRYTAELRLHNTGDSLGRRVAIVFSGLPAGVALRNASGTTPDGVPYLNVQPAIPRGGLGRGLRSERVLVEFDDPTQVPFTIRPQILSGTNQPPTLAAIGTLTAMPGDTLSTQLSATDPDGDPVTFSLGSIGSSSAPLNLPTGILRGNGLLEFTPAPGELGQYTFDVIASDSALEARRSVTLNVVADPTTTTRISGFIRDVDQSPLAGMQVEIGAVQGLTQSDGSFTLDLGAGPLVSDTLKVRGETFPGPLAYPFIAEKLAFILEHAVFPGVNNVIGRPIFLPPLDVANGKTIDPMQDTTVTTAAIPGASVFVKAGTLMNQQGTPFTGVLSITEVPRDLTPAALPDTFFPELVVTIQPGEMVFATPAPMTFPNRAGWAPGTLMDLWSINPVTGEFDDVGDMEVSADGTTIDTISGGVRNSSWHTPIPPPPEPPDPPKLDPVNQDKDRKSQPTGCPGACEIEMHSGALTEWHETVPYQSLGMAHNVVLTYDSERVNARPSVGITFQDLPTRTAPSTERVVASTLTIRRGAFQQQVPGGAIDGLPLGSFLWTVDNDAQGNTPARVAVEADLSHQPTGRYDYSISAGVFAATNSRTNFAGSTDSFSGQVVHVNELASPFGAGWGVNGLMKLVENPDGSVILVDGIGSESTFEPSAQAGGPFVSPAGDFSTLERLPNGRFRRTEPDRTVHEFNAANQLAFLRDRNGNQTEYQYDSEGRLVAIVDPVGLATTFTYQNGRLSSITDPAARTTSFQIDANGNLAQITDPDGTKRHFEYDAAHRMTAEVDKRGRREEISYDRSGRVERVLRRDGTEVLYRTLQRAAVSQGEATDTALIPSASTDITTDALMIEPSGNVLRIQLDRAGQTIASRDSVGPLPRVNRDRDNLLIGVTDARDNRTGFRYDDRGNLTARFDGVSGGDQPELPGRVIATNRNFSGVSGATDDFNGDNVPDIVFPDVLGDSIFVFLSQDTSHGAVNYGTPREITVGSGPRVVVFDVNGDSRPDLATVNSGDGTVSVLVGNGQGGFASRPAVPFGDFSTSVAVADFNRDGSDDLIVNGAFNGALSVLLADGSGGLRNPATIPVSSSGGHLAAGDLDLDQKADFVLTDTTNNAALVFRGRGDGTFDAPQAFAVSPFPFDVAVGDVTGDGKPDVVATSHTETKINVLAGDGAGGFPMRNDIDTTGFPVSLRIADVNAGGVPDVVVVNRAGDLKVQSLFVYRGEQALAPAPPVATGSFNGPSFTDLNGDGQLDVVLFGSGAVEQLYGRADGSFAAANFIPVTVSQIPSAATVGDFNRDGLADLVTASETGNVGSVLRGLSSGGFGLAGTVDFEGPKPDVLTSADIDGDGALDLVTASRTPSTVRVFLGDGAGAFQLPLPIGFGAYTSLVVHDFNGDNRLDMAAGRPDNDRVDVFIRDAGPGLTFTGSSHVVGDEPQVVRTADLNLDGFPDLVTANKGGSSVTILLGDGTGAFGTPANIAVPGNPTDVVIGDFNLNGFPDLVVNHSDVTKLTLLAGDGTGQFNQQTPLTIDTRASSFAASGRTALAAADLDDDGPTDIIVAQDDVVHVLFPDGAGTFSQVSFQTNLDSNTDNSDHPFVLAADVDNNAAIDLVMVESQSSGVTVLPNINSVAQRWTYDATFSQPTSFTDELGRQAFYEIDPANGNTTKITRVVGQLDATSGETDDVGTRLTYNARGQILTQIDPLGRLTEYAYNSLGRMTATTVAKGTAVEATTGYEYDAAGNNSAIVDANGHRTEFTYDALNRVTQIVRPDPDDAGSLASPMLTSIYDPNGNVVSTTDALGNTTRWIYDSMNRPVEMIDAQNHSSQMQYDSVSNLTRATDELGHATQNRYDARRRLVESIDPSGGRTRFKYDADNNLTAVIDPVGNESRTAYDQRNRVIAQIDPLDAMKQFRYDAADQLIETTDRNGRVTRFAYDNLSRLTQETWLAADLSTQNSIANAYDAAGNLLSVQDVFSSLTTTYDARNRLSTVSNAGTPGAPAVVLTYQYDAVGNPLSVADTIGGAAGAVTIHAFDGLDRMIRVTQTRATGSAIATQDKRVDFTYDAHNQVTDIARFADAAGAVAVADSSFDYDTLNRLTSLVHRNAANFVLDSFALAFDAASRITRITDSEGGNDYTYDSRDQLVGAGHDSAGNPDEKYTYDANGNRVASSRHASGYRTGPSNRLLSDGTFNYAYDAEGNLIRRTEIVSGNFREFKYDHRNRLVTVLDKNAAGTAVQRTEYTYDALNRRIARAVDDSPADAVAPPVDHFVYDHKNVILDFTDPDGRAGPAATTLERRYLHGSAVDQVFAEDDGIGGVQWYLTDHLGTTRDLVDNAGSVLNHFVYDSFGNVISQVAAGPTTRYLFTGREFDPSIGLYYYRARYYDAALGRFMSEDPLGFGAGDANQYRYVNNNPVMNVDPTGLWGKPCTPQKSDEKRHIKPLTADEEEYVKSLKPKPDELVLIRADETDIEVSKNPNTYHKSFLGETLKAGDHISTGPDGEAHILFPDGSVMVVKELTQLSVDTLLMQGSALKAQVGLKVGEVSAQVNPAKVISTDLSVRTPVATTSVRG